MSVFHRFYRLFPLIVLLVALGACAGANQNPWNKSAGGYTSPSSAADNTGAGVQAQPYGSNAGLTPAPASGAAKVAILLPLSGKNAALGQSMLQAAQLALFDLGYDNFELIPRDTGGTAYGASAAATSALTDGAQLILGPVFAEEVRAVKSTTAGSGINVIAFSTDWTLAGGNTYMMGFLPFGQVERIASFAASKGLKQTAVSGGTDLYATTASKIFEQAAHRNGIALPSTLSNPSSYDSVFVPVAGTALNGVLARISNPQAQKLGTGLWDDSRLAANPLLNGAWFAAPSPSARAAFESRYKSTYGSAPVRIATLAYDATALAAALSRDGLGAQSFAAAKLSSRNGFAGVDGIIRFNQNGLAERGMAVLGFKNGQILELDPAPRSFGP